MVAASLFTLSWATSLGAVYHAGAQNNLALAVGLAYPVSDLIMVAVVVLVLVQARARSGLILLGVGLGLMAVADSGFAYLTAAGTYQTGSPVDTAWFAAFLVIGLSAVLSDGREEAATSRVASPVYLALPYLLLTVGVAAVIDGVVGGTVEPVAVVVELIALGALLVRQFLTVLENRRLALDVMEQQDELRFRAFHDALTGLANRALFYDRVSHALDLHRRDMRTVTVMFCDLDDFKSVNDTLGHDAGDALLAAVAERLRAVVRTGDTIARLGGDEFAILLEDDGEAAELAGRLQDALAAPVPIENRLVPVRASVGTATVHPADASTDIQELLKRADIAMYAAKRAGKSTSVAYTPELREQITDDLDLRLRLAQDVEAGQVRTAYQPIVLADGRPYAFEALARWSYRGETMAPARVIPIAARAGLLPALDLLMIRNALARTQGPGPERSRKKVSVNLGLTHLPDADLPARLIDLLAEFGVPSSRLIVEISENEAVEDPRALATLERLRELGVSLALDDFGVGYSSLGRFGTLSPEIVKLDRSFVALLSAPAPSPRLLEGVIDLAHRCGSFVIGDGVETEHQLNTLRELGCDAMQGFLVGDPVVWPPDAVDLPNRAA